VLLYQTSSNIVANQMAWYDRGGKLLGTGGAPGRVVTPAISLDERSVVFSRYSTVSSDLWLRELTRGTEQGLTEGSFDASAVWAPQGHRVAFSSTRAGRVASLYAKRVSVRGQDELLLATESTGDVPTQWSRDGRFIVYSELDPKNKFSLWVLPMDSGAERKPIPLLRSESNELHGQLSPDSNWMAYTSDESGQREVYVRPFPRADDQWKISIAGGEQPRWRGDGKELFFVGGDGKMMAVAVKAMIGTKPSFEPLLPRPLFEVHFDPSSPAMYFQYDVTRDGNRFLLDSVAARQASTPFLNVVANWDAGLKK
jgi:Tol biopolymer transport system component